MTSEQLGPDSYIPPKSLQIQQRLALLAAAESDLFTGNLEDRQANLLLAEWYDLPPAS